MKNNNYLLAFTLVGISLLNVCNLHAQVKDSLADHDGVPDILDMEEIVVSATKLPVIKTYIPQQIVTITAAEIASQNAGNAADVLQNASAAYIQKSQQGGGSVNLRGFEANKVLFVVDGVRMNNAIYRAGHLQNIITIDPNIMENMEVLYGAGSTLYGSDAIGGVVSVFSKKASLNTKNGNAFTRYSSANQGFTTHVDFNFGSKKWAFLSAATASNFGDLRKGANYDIFYKNDKIDYKNSNNCLNYVARINGKDSILTNEDANLQRGSAYAQYDFMQKILFQPNAKNTHLLNVQYSTSSNVPRYDRLQNFATTPKYSEWNYGPQNRFLATYRFEHFGNYRLADRIVVQPAYQIIDESRLVRKYKNDVLNANIEKLNIASLNIEIYKQFNQKQNLVYGAEMVQNNLLSVGENRNIVSSINQRAVSRYPNAQLLTGGVFAAHRWRMNDAITLSGGLRYSFTKIDALFDTLFYDKKLVKTMQQNDALTWNLGATANLSNGFWCAAMVSTAFRAPNVDDMGKIFEQNNGTLQVPNANLRPEKVMYKELSLQKRFGNQTHIDFTVFHASLSDVIAVKNYSQNGSDSTMYNGTKFKMVANTNINNAETYGASLAAKIVFNRFWSTNFAATYTRGNDLTNGGRLDHIAPIYGNFGVNYDNKNWAAAFYSNFNTWKHLYEYRLNAEDNEAFATPDGTPAWATANIRIAKRFAFSSTQSLKVQFAVENILDTNYRSFASGINAAGRNFLLTLRYAF